MANSENAEEESLHSAAKCGRKDGVELFLGRGERVNNCDRHGLTALHYAAERGHLEIVKFLLEKGANVNAVRYGQEDSEFPFHRAPPDDDSLEDEDYSPLHFAAREGHLEVVKYLIDKGADAKGKDAFDQDPPIHLAAQSGHLDVVKFFLDLGVNVNILGKHDFTPLHAAVLERRLEVMQCLVEKGANPNSETAIFDEKPAHIAAKLGYIDVIEFFLNLGTQAVDSNSRCETSLHFAAHGGHMEAVKFLVEKGLDVNAQNSYGFKPLHHAARYGHDDIVEFFIDLGVNINSCSTGNLTALHLAVSQGQPEVVTYLLQKNPNLDIRDRREGKTALHCAIEYRFTCSDIGYTDLAERLIKWGANLDVQDNKGKTALHYAIENRYRFSDTAYFDIVEHLIKFGANLDIEDLGCRTSLQYAIESGFDDTAEQLIKLGANLSKQDRELGKTLLHYVIENGCSFELLRCVLQNQKEYVNVKDKFGNTPFSYLILLPEPSSNDKWLEAVNLLVEAGAYLTRDVCRHIASHALQAKFARNVNLCAQVIVNKFNNKDLPALYKLHIPDTLPPIEKMKIKKNSGAMREIERAVETEIESSGYYNLLKKSPVLLTLLSVKAYNASNKQARQKWSKILSTGRYTTIQRVSNFSLGIPDRTEASSSNTPGILNRCQVSNPNTPGVLDQSEAFKPNGHGVPDQTEASSSNTPGVLDQSEASSSHKQLKRHTPSDFSSEGVPPNKM